MAADARWIHVIAWPNAMARRACRRRPYHHGVLMHALTLHLVLIAVLGSAQRLAAPAQYFREVVEKRGVLAQPGTALFFTSPATPQG